MPTTLLSTSEHLEGGLFGGTPCKHLHFTFINMGRVYLQGNCVGRPALGVEVERSIDVSSHVFTHRDVVLFSKFISLEKENKIAHMSNEAVHRIVCSLTDCALPEILLLLFCLVFQNT